MLIKWLRRIYYTTGIGTLLQRLDWRRQHSARYQIRKIKRGLRSGDQKRSLLFQRNYSARAWAAPVGYEWHYDDPDHTAQIIDYFRRRGYAVEISKFGKNLFIYEVRRK